MAFRVILWFCVLLVSVSGVAQQAPLRKMEHSDVAGWKRINQQLISNDGRWVVYTLEPNEGDGSLHAYDSQEDKTLDFPRGEQAALSADSRFLAFRIKPPRDTVQAMRRRKVKKENLPQDTLGIVDLSNGKITRIPHLQSFQMPSKWSGLLVYQKEPAKQAAPRDSTAQSNKRESTENGSTLVLLNLLSGAEKTVAFVKGYTLAAEAPAVLLSSTGDDRDFLPGVYQVDPQSFVLKPIFRGKGTYKSLQMSRNGAQAAFLADLDSSSAVVRPWALYHWKGLADTARLAVASGAAFMPKGWMLSEFAQPEFSRDGAHLFFGIAPPAMLQDTNLLEEEIVQVEVWNYQDPRIYPQQKVQLSQDKRRAYSSVYHTATGKAVALGGLDLPEVRNGQEGNAAFALGTTSAPYAIEATWEGGSRRDIYLVDILSGKRTLVEKGAGGFPAFSPEARYVYWYEPQDSSWYAFDVVQKKKGLLVNSKTSLFCDELNDVPALPGSYGIAGWTTNDDFVMIYDRFDIWLVDPTGRLKPTNLTNSRAASISLRYIRTNPEERSIEEVKPLLLKFTNEKTLEEGYLWYDIHAGSKRIVQQGPFSYSNQVLKAKNASRWVFSKGDFQTFPDLLLSTNLSDSKQVSHANPQQAAFGWGSIELYEWTALDGQKLRGMLVKPAGYTPGKQYPMIVNFYERSSEGLYAHRAPEWGRSQINYAYYANRGYLVFNPDIPYREGYPGESAFNAVISGVASLVDKGLVDKSRIALQGHSWGGYQIAYLLTKTDMFKCAESGAPVVNMISAYGGIRWESGVSRQFQYEKTQSRIGAPLWDKPLRYIENSPIFFADKINTPVLILHNDADGAVPWYQGIEFYMAMRRLNKPAWMLNYNGEPHWPVKLQNRKDFQMRMEQFFDHYLQDAPAPRWMREGVPALEQGIRSGLERD